MFYQQNPYTPQDAYAQPQLASNDPAVQQSAYPPLQQPYGAPPHAPASLKVSNQWANRALFSGMISLALSLVTLYSLVGFAGLITGTFAIIRGVAALNRSKRLPGNVGRGKAIAAIVMGTLAWTFVLISFLLRSGHF